VAAAVIGFLASAVTVANFLGFDGWSGESPAEPPAAAVVPSTTGKGALPPVPQTKPRPPAVDAGAAQPVVPQQFHGKWFGQVYQGGDSPYPVELEITGGSSGTRIGTVSYPSLQCGGRWELRAAWDNKISSTEHIEYQGNCITPVEIDLVMQPDGQVFYSFKIEGGGAGVLRRRQ
jgi:hypothetical protein